MDKTALAQELQQVVNTMFWTLGQLTCDKHLEDEMYIAIYAIERVITELENE